MRKCVKEYIIHDWPIIIIAVLGLAFMARTLIGFDWSDETYYAAGAYRLVLGDAAFQSSWDIHQFSFIITVPLLAIYKFISGSMEGVILFLRIVYTLFKCAAVIFSYYQLKNHISPLGALLTSSMFYLTPFSVFTFSYNTISVLCFAFAFLMLVSKSEIKSHRFFLSGVFTAIGVQAYPFTVFALLCFFAYFFIIRKKQPEVRKGAVLYIAGGIAVGAVVLIYLHWNSSLENVIANIHYLFYDPEHTEIAFSFADHLSGLWQGLGNPFILCAGLLTVVSIIISFIKNSGRKQKMQACVEMVAASAVLIYAISRLRVAWSVPIYHILFTAISALGPMLFFLYGRRWHVSTLLYALGICFSIAVDIGSNNGANGYAYPYILSAAATVFYAFAMHLAAHNKDGTRQNVLRLSGVALIGMLMFCNINYVYRDAPIAQLNTQLRTGPAAGIFVTEEEADKYHIMIDAIDRFMPRAGRVLYIKLLPFGYLCSVALPASPRLWRTNLNYSGFAEYYKNNPDNTPNAVFIADEAYGITNDNILYGDFFIEYMATRDHDTITTDAGTIIMFNED